MDDYDLEMELRDEWIDVVKPEEEPEDDWFDQGWSVP